MIRGLWDELDAVGRAASNTLSAPAPLYPVSGEREKRERRESCRTVGSEHLLAGLCRPSEARPVQPSYTSNVLHPVHGCPVCGWSPAADVHPISDVYWGYFAPFMAPGPVASPVRVDERTSDPTRERVST